MADWTDTHAHLDSDRFDADRVEVVRRARAAGVRRLVLVATDLDSADRILRLIERDPDLYAVVGVHAHDCGKFDAGTVARIEALLGRARAVGIGETGLDYFRDYAPRDAQIAAFQAQAELAARMGKPVVVHCRDAEEDVLRILEAAASKSGGRLRGVMHCFSSNAAWAARFCSLGLHVSFSGSLTYPKSGDLRVAAAGVPEDRILLETDCPFLPPQSHRGKRNEPALLVETGAALAKLRGWPLEDTAARTTANAAALFGEDLR